MVGADPLVHGVLIPIVLYLYWQCSQLVLQRVHGNAEEHDMLSACSTRQETPKTSGDATIGRPDLLNEQ